MDIGGEVRQEGISVCHIDLPSVSGRGFGNIDSHWGSYSWKSSNDQ